MISDFGTANLAKEHTQTSKTVNFSPTYRPPEHDDADSFVDSKWDVWSLGCLFLEFTTWLLMGKEGVEEFSNSRVGVDATFSPGIPTDSFFWQCEKEVNGEMQRVVDVKPAVSKVSYRPQDMFKRGGGESLLAYTVFLVDRATSSARDMHRASSPLFDHH
jgi:serine/threonine protein kinase